MAAAFTLRIQERWRRRARLNSQPLEVSVAHFCAQETEHLSGADLSDPFGQGEKDGKKTQVIIFQCASSCEQIQAPSWQLKIWRATPLSIKQDR